LGVSDVSSGQPSFIPLLNLSLRAGKGTVPDFTEGDEGRWDGRKIREVSREYIFLAMVQSVNLIYSKVVLETDDRGIL
jgi:hypothetical protein